MKGRKARIERGEGGEQRTVKGQRQEETESEAWRLHADQEAWDPRVTGSLVISEVLKSVCMYPESCRGFLHHVYSSPHINVSRIIFQLFNWRTLEQESS